MNALAQSIGATHRFGALSAVSEVTMEVHEGEVVGLLGANGAGKTTLIRMLLGLLPPTAGDVLLFGHVPDRETRRRLGYVPQSLGLYADLTARENLSFIASAFGVPTPEPDAGLLPYADRLVRAIPLGQQRRLAFQGALLHSPELLILDEPTSGVDPIARAALWDTIRDQANAGVGVLVTTHYMQEAEQCDRLLLMSDGVLVAQGNEADLVGGTTAVEVRCQDWAAAFDALERAGQAVTLAGTAVRVADADPDQLHGVLVAAGVAADLVAVPATIEERMTVLARSGGSS